MNFLVAFLLLVTMLTLCHSLYWSYSGQDKHDKSKDAFNFYLYQLRIQIEQAFGLLVTKWHIFKKLLEVSFWWTTFLIEACFHLHNFCIKEQEIEVLNINTAFPESFTPSFAEHLVALEPGVSRSAKWNTVREAILQTIKSDGQSWPSYNISRNNNILI